MAYIGLPPKANFTSGLLDRFTSTTGTTVTLTNDISSENDIVVFVNFVKQDSTTYSVGGTGNKTLTLGGTLVSSDIVEVHYLNIVGQTVAPSSGSVGSSQLTADSITGQTAETSIATDDTVLIHDTSAGALRKMTRANFVSGVGGANTPSFHAYLSSNQTVSDNADTKVQFDTEIFDSDNCYDNSSNYRFTPNVAGKYFVYASARADEGTSDLYKIQNGIKKNGSQATGIGQTSWDGRNGTGTDSSTYSAGIIDMNGSSDYLEVHVQVDSVSGSDSALKNVGTYFGAYRIIT